MKTWRHHQLKKVLYLVLLGIYAAFSLGLALGMENAAQDNFGSIMETKKLR